MLRTPAFAARTVRRAQVTACCAAALLAAPGARAACLSDTQAVELVDRFLARMPAANPEGLSDADGACSRGKVNALLALQYRAVIGYKAGLTNPAVQKRFSASQPVWGVLYDGMVLADGATVDAGFGARPLFEADLLVRVSSDAINRATTPAEVLDAIDQIIPFIELPDLVVDAPGKLNGAAVSAINVGARLGVAGQPLAVPRTRAERYALLEALATMSVVLGVETGGAATSSVGRGSDILSHPLAAVVWLAQALGKEGLAMQPGQLISLGSFSPLSPPKPGMKVTVSYPGLPGAAPVTVNFR